MKTNITLSLLFITMSTFAQVPFRQAMEANFTHDEFMLGSSSGYPQMTTESQVILDREYNYVTPTNEFKQTAIYRFPGDEYRWDKADAFVESCLNNNQVIRMHSPISPQCSEYCKEDDRTAEELGVMLTDYLIPLCQRYNSVEHILWMDVVNETIAKDGTWFGPREGTDKWENPWPIMGYDSTVALVPPVYIDSAFQLTNKYAPDVLQMINQHGDFEEVVWEKMKELVAYLRDRGRHIDGLGWQAHIDVEWEKVPGNMERLSAFIDWCHANDLAFHITEFNVWLRDGMEGELEAQAVTFSTLVNLVKEKSKNGPTGVNFWQISCLDSQHADRDGSIWDIDHNQKQSHDSIYAKIKECDDDISENNLVPNPSFEQGIAINWQKKVFGGASGDIYNSPIAYSCINACHIEVETAMDIANAGVETLPISLPENIAELEASAWVKGMIGTEARTQMVFELNDGTNKHSPSAPVVLTGDFTELKHLFTVPDDVKNFIFRIQCGGTVGSYYVDAVTVQEPGTSGINDEKHSSFTISPNPANGIIYITTESIHNTYSIFNLAGHLVLTGQLEGMHSSIDISQLPNGYYMVKLDSGEMQKLLVA